MVKAGMKRYVSNYKDPTYDQALGNIRKQERAAAFTAMLKVRRMLEAAGSPSTLKKKCRRTCWP